jgi:hypothetical protein
VDLIKAGKSAWFHQWGRRYFIFVIPSGSGYLKKIQNQRTTGSVYSENFQIQRTAGFHERTGKDLVVLRRYLVFFHFLELQVYN